MPEDLPQYQDQPFFNPRGLRLFLLKSPIQYGRGVAAFDALAVISWEEQQLLEAPRVQNFLRIVSKRHRADTHFN